MKCPVLKVASAEAKFSKEIHSRMKIDQGKLQLLGEDTCAERGIPPKLDMMMTNDKDSGSLVLGDQPASSSSSSSNSNSSAQYVLDENHQLMMCGPAMPVKFMEYIPMMSGSHLPWESRNLETICPLY
jgi:hypothetical protein